MPAMNARPPLSIFIIPPLGVFILLIASFALEGAYLRHSLDVALIREVASGDPLPIAARLIARRGEARFELVEEGTIEAALLIDGSVRHEASLEPIGGGLFIGTLETQGALGEGELSLRASGVSLRMPVQINPERRALPLRALKPSNEERSTADAAPARSEALKLYVESGRCVPEFPCRLVLIAAGGADELELSSERGLIWLADEERRGDAAISRRVKVQNLQPLARLSADGSTRTASIAIAPGGVATELSRRLFEEGERVEIAFDSLDEREPLYALYLDGALIELGRAKKDASKAALRLGPLAPGDYRLEIDVDPFAEEISIRTAAHRFIVAESGARLQPDRELTLLREEALRVAPLYREEAAKGDRGDERADIRTLRLVSAGLILLIGALQALLGTRYFRRHEIGMRSMLKDAFEDEAELSPAPLLSPAARFSVAILIAYALVAFIVLSRSYIFL